MSRIYSILVILICCSFSSRKNKLKLPEDFVFIPSAQIELNDESFNVGAFMMLDHEVTNSEYRSFLIDLKNTGKTEALEVAKLDTCNWSETGSFMQAMTNMYAWHPAYDNYPVVNVSPDGAKLYCKWLSKKLRIEYGDDLNDVRIPSKQEWVIAAKGGDLKANYPWGHSYLFNSEGDYLANFFVIGDQNIRKTDNGFEVISDSTFCSDQTVDYAFLTAPVKSYLPNGYGLYNMSGNVAELCADNQQRGGHWGSTGYDIRVTSEIPFEKTSPYVGFRPVITFSGTK